MENGRSGGKGDDTYSAQFDDAAKQKIETMHSLVNSAVNQTSYETAGIASVLGMDEDTILFILPDILATVDRFIIPKKYLASNVPEEDKE